MDVLILTHGTRGDVQPFVALARALTNAGHTARLGAPSASTALAESYSVDFLPLSDGPNELMSDDVVRQVIETNYRGARGKKLAVQVARRFRRKMDAVLDDIAETARQGADVIVHDIVLPGRHLSEWLGVPAVRVCLQPFWAPTRAFPNPMHNLHLPSACNRLTYQTTKLWYQILAGRIGRWRTKTLGLPKERFFHDDWRRAGGRPTPLIQAFSAHLLETLPDDYPPWVNTTGFWLLEAPPDWVPPSHLVEFIERKDPPVYIGFGSMAGVDPARTGRIVSEAVRLAGVRALVATGWGGIRSDEVNDDVLFLREAPHGWLFNQVAAVVHHGGSGTSAAALAAARPQVVCPFVLDQPYFARRIHELGVAPAPLPQRDLDPVSLARAIETAMTDPAMARSAREVGTLVRTEGGAERAIEIVEEAVATASSTGGAS